MPGTRTTQGDEMLQAAAAVLRDHGAEGWLVGGTVRDLELGCSPPDIDLAVTGDAAAVARDLARILGIPWFTLSEEHQAYRVVGVGRHVDVAAVRGGAILTDLAQRDFTVNAMARPLGSDGLLDPFGGLGHLRERRLVAVSSHIFDDDPLRVMRAARFSHVLGLHLDAELVEAVRAQAGEVHRAAPERVEMEMVMTLSAGRAGDAARLWDELGLLTAVFPELAQMPRTGLFAFLDQLETMLAEPARWFPEAGQLLRQRLAEPVDGTVSRPVALRLAGLLRALPPRDATGIARRLRFSVAVTSLLERSARMRAYGEETRVTVEEGMVGRQAVLFLWEAAPWEAEIILLSSAAAEGSAAPSISSLTLRRLMSLWAVREGRGMPQLPFDGVALMHELQLPPGPRLGKALKAARLAWEAGEATTVDEALAAAREAAEEGLDACDQQGGRPHHEHRCKNEY